MIFRIAIASVLSFFVFLVAVGAQTEPSKNIKAAKPASKTEPTTLPEILKWIQNELIINATFDKKGASVVTTYKVTDPTFSECSLKYTDVTSIYSLAGMGGGGTIINMSLLLTDLDPDVITVQPYDGAYALQLNTLDNKLKIERKSLPLIIGNQVLGSGSTVYKESAVVPFADSKIANNVAKKFSEAITLCKNPTATSNDDAQEKVTAKPASTNSPSSLAQQKGASASPTPKAIPEWAPLQEWQTSWKKFEAHLLKEGADLIAETESRAREKGSWQESGPSTYGLVVTNGSLGLMVALSNGPVAPSKLTDKHKQMGFGAEVEFSATFKGTKVSNDGEKKTHKSDMKLDFENPLGGCFCFSDPRESEMTKWKSVKAGTKVRWRATVSAVALWTIQFGKAIPIVTFTNVRIID